MIGHSTTIMPSDTVTKAQKNRDRWSHQILKQKYGVQYKKIILHKAIQHQCSQIVTQINICHYHYSD